MTSKLTRERLQEIAEDGFLKHGESKELARMALAAMDGEPDCKERKLFCSTDTARMRKVISVSAGSGDAPLYRHAQQPVVSADLLHTAASAIEDLLTTKDRTGAGVWFDLPFRLRSAANAQPAPVVPTFDEWLELSGNKPLGWVKDAMRESYDACRAAMLAAAPQEE